ncbi:MAG: starch-binding protein [Muribaculaceae bacterium]|nr:starch-binding protein [Muribaculaceae bacterium]
MNIVKKALCAATLAATALGAQAATFVGDRSDFRDETIYFAMTTRFYDGDTANNTYCWDGELNVNDPEWRGDFKGLIEKLDYIKALGFTAVWITPVVENASGLDYHGYHAFDFSKVDPRYESADCKFQDLIDAVHARGMKLILDIVLQHTGNFGEANLCPMFVKDYTQNLSNINTSMKLAPNSKLPSNYNSLQPGEQYSRRLGLMKNTRGINEDTHNYWHHYAHFNWDDPTRWWGQIAGDCVDLNTENPATSNYIVDCYSKFIKMGVDGFRIDTSGHISRLTFNKAFIPQLHEAAKSAEAIKKRGNTPFYMFGEVCARAEEVIYRDGNYNCSPCFYTWKEDKDYDWDYSDTAWDKYVVMEGETGDHVNAKSVLKQADDYMGKGSIKHSKNAWLSGNDYHAPDYSQSSGFNVIDFPMHWRFHRAENAFGVRSQDDYYNDATWNVVYVDGHDYGPNGWDTKSFGGSLNEWAENLSLMFTWRGIPCIWQGTETNFRKGVIIDKGAIEALKNTARAYYGGYLTGSVKTTDFAEYSDATGNLAASLTHPLAIHLQRLNKIRAAVPALRKGQYSTDGCSGKMAFKRRFTDANTDSYVLVTVSGDASFTGILNGTYTDVVTGDTKTVTDGKLSVKCSGQGNFRAYVLSTSKTPAPGKIGTDNRYVYASSPVTKAQEGYDGHEEDGDFVTVKDSGGIIVPPVEEPENPIAPSMSEGEQAVFFEASNGWSSVNCYAWNGATQYFGKWSGSPMTYLGNKVWKITYTGSEVIPATAGLIFNNGGQQTADLTWVNGGYYNESGYVKTIEGAGEIVVPPVDPVEPGVFTAYFDNSSSNWSDVKVWCWDANNNKNYTGGTWPGQSISLDATTGYHKFTCTVTDANPKMMIIFNNGSGTQTADLEFFNNGIYSAAGFTGQYVSGIDDATVSHMIVYTEGHALVIDTPTAASVLVVRPDGVSFNLDAQPGRNAFTLPRGLYIVNGKKVIL